MAIRKDGIRVFRSVAGSKGVIVANIHALPLKPFQPNYTESDFDTKSYTKLATIIEIVESRVDIQLFMDAQARGFENIHDRLHPRQGREITHLVGLSLRRILFLPPSASLGG